MPNALPAFKTGVTRLSAVRFKRAISVGYLRERFGFVPPQSFRYISPEYQLFFKDERVQVTHRHKHFYRA